MRSGVHCFGGGICLRRMATYDAKRALSLSIFNDVIHRGVFYLGDSTCDFPYFFSHVVHCGLFCIAPNCPAGGFPADEALRDVLLRFLSSNRNARFIINRVIMATHGELFHWES